ncbi:MAG: hypothetical protein L6R39_002990 [Caloplaca ligustica]|nr:MAG: hypothetical protein L6R39_002990 [Caloplaca ligustica]
MAVGKVVTLLYKDSLSLPEAKFLTGWSHGKEALKNGSYDTFKGSFYVNCGFYYGSGRSGNGEDEYAKYPELTASNVWPPEGLLPGFRQCFEQLCTLIIDTAALVARACDRYASAEMEGYEPGYLERVVRTSTTTKARLLHYFPTQTGTGAGLGDRTENEDDDDLDESAPPIPSPQQPSLPLPPLPFLPSAPDPDSGLYIRSRTGTTTKVAIPSDCLAFQTGEALQLITGGRFQAVPHFVRAGRASGNGRRIARNTLAVFTQPGLDEIVDRSTGKTFAQFSRQVVGRFN